VRADCTSLPLRSACSQLVFCASVLEHLPDVLPATSEIARILEFGGKSVVGVPTENALYGMGRKLAGLRKPVDHFHKGVHLEAALGRKFTRSLSRKLPFSFLPTFLALYLISVYEKSREQWPVLVVLRMCRIVCHI
jgi:ubiquinone/menaquinone biosynthesis C-methylase UbiE